MRTSADEETFLQTTRQKRMSSTKGLVKVSYEILRSRGSASEADKSRTWRGVSRWQRYACRDPPARAGGQPCYLFSPRSAHYAMAIRIRHRQKALSPAIFSHGILFGASRSRWPPLRLLRALEFPQSADCRMLALARRRPMLSLPPRHPCASISPREGGRPLGRWRLRQRMASFFVLPSDILRANGDGPARRSHAGDQRGVERRGCTACRPGGSGGAGRPAALETGTASPPAHTLENDARAQARCRARGEQQPRRAPAPRSDHDGARAPDAGEVPTIAPPFLRWRAQLQNRHYATVLVVFD